MSVMYSGTGALKTDFTRCVPVPVPVPVPCRRLGHAAAHRGSVPPSVPVQHGQAHYARRAGGRREQRGALLPQQLPRWRAAGRYRPVPGCAALARTTLHSRRADGGCHRVRVQGSTSRRCRAPLRSAAPAASWCVPRPPPPTPLRSPPPQRKLMQELAVVVLGVTTVVAFLMPQGARAACVRRACAVRAHASLPPALLTPQARPAAPAS